MKISRNIVDISSRDSLFQPLDGRRADVMSDVGRMRHAGGRCVVDTGGPGEPAGPGRRAVHQGLPLPRHERQGGLPPR